MCLPVSSGMDAWSEWRSFLKLMFPNCNTADTTFNRPDKQTEEVSVFFSAPGHKMMHLYMLRQIHSLHGLWGPLWSLWHNDVIYPCLLGFTWTHMRASTCSLKFVTLLSVQYIQPNTDPRFSMTGPLGTYVWAERVCNAQWPWKYGQLFTVTWWSVWHEVIGRKVYCVIHWHVCIMYIQEINKTGEETSNNSSKAPLDVTGNL